jgi:predicted nucleic acid-binding protein
MEKYADLPMDLADGSLIVLAEHLGHGRILSTDQRDFNAYRWKQNKPFENLLFS